jgi:hypothetical protein
MRTRPESIAEANRRNGDLFDTGKDCGLRLALDILTRETARQEHRAQVATSGNPLERAGSQHELVVAVLRDVSKQVGAEFRRCAA